MKPNVITATTPSQIREQINSQIVRPLQQILANDLDPGAFLVGMLGWSKRGDAHDQKRRIVKETYVFTAENGQDVKIYFDYDWDADDKLTQLTITDQSGSTLGKWTYFWKTSGDFNQYELDRVEKVA